MSFHLVRVLPDLTQKFRLIKDLSGAELHENKWMQKAN
jgi:hypothetical protein